MSDTEPRSDVTFDRLRHAHRSERAPAELRRRALGLTSSARTPAKRSRTIARGLFGLFAPERGNARARGQLLVLAASVAAVVWFTVNRFASRESIDAGAPVARWWNVVPSAEPPGTRELAGGRCPKPLPPYWILSDSSFPRSTSGLGVGVVAMESACGQMNRRVLLQKLEGTAASAAALILLHDAGQSPEQNVLYSTRGWVNDLARRERFLLVFANGSPRVNGEPATGDRAETDLYAGVWQTDEGVHPAVDDHEYLRAIVADVRERREGPPDVPRQLLAADGEVFLAGYGSGAVMALAAALRHPERYSGVAAFLTPRTLPLAALARAGAPRRVLTDRRLRSVFVVLPPGSDDGAEDAVAVARHWAEVLGSELGAVRSTREPPGVQRIDARLEDGTALRILLLAARVDPFPLPGAGDGVVGAAARANPFFFDGARAAWEFLRQPKP
jgi:poly(3-hydroxybutyrate) depolymerase